MKILKQYYSLIKIVWNGGGKGILFVYITFMILGTIMPTIVAYSQKLFIISMEKLSVFIAVSGCLILYVVIKYFNSIYQYIDSFFAHKFIFKVKFIINTEIV